MSSRFQGAELVVRRNDLGAWQISTRSGRFVATFRDMVDAQLHAARVLGVSGGGRIEVFADSGERTAWIRVGPALPKELRRKTRAACIA